MPEYRRRLVPGGTYFFAVNLLDRRSSLLTERIDLLRASVRRVRALAPFRIDACVVLPDHMHAVWTLPEGDANFRRRWQAIKMGFSKGVAPGEAPSASRRVRGERGVWQRRYWEHAIRDARDYAAHVDYVHFNPVKHGLAETPAEWPYSSFPRAVAAGLYPADWAGADGGSEERGERR